MEKEERIKEIRCVMANLKRRAVELENMRCNVRVMEIICKATQEYIEGNITRLGKIIEGENED